MKNRNLIRIAVASGMMLGATTLQSCEDENGNGTVWDEILNGLADIITFNGHEYSTNCGDNYFGWFGLDEDPESIQDDINLASRLPNTKTGSLPSRVDNTKWLPVIGNQGQYGTCVAWATGYNCRTYLYAKSHGLTTSQLNSNNTFSPADIYMSLSQSSNERGANCNGSYFEACFNKMINRGIATLSTAPYSNLNCGGSPSSSWTSNASKYKIKSFREITPITKDAIKQYLAQGELVVFGAALGDEFMYANDATVLTRQTSFNSTGQHAYHAMVCAGYDDSKGANGAFRVVNSWGTSWGDNGYIWVDEDFFVSKFVCWAYVAYDFNDNNHVEVDDDNTVVYDERSDGYDLIASDNFDFYRSTFNDGRSCWACEYDVYNAGKNSVSSSNDWAICLLYYNAYDANDYGILLLDYYTDDFGYKGKIEGNWDISDAYNHFGFSSTANISGFAWNNVDVKSGQSCNEACGGTVGISSLWKFTLPSNLNGSYYIVLAADAFNNIAESNEENNYLFYTADDNMPIKFTNGVPSNLSKSQRLSKTYVCPSQNAPNRCQDVRTEQNYNAYTSDEIGAMIQAHMKSGRLADMTKSLSKSAVVQRVEVEAKIIGK